LAVGKASMGVRPSVMGAWAAETRMAEADEQGEGMGSGREQARSTRQGTAQSTIVEFALIHGNPKIISVDPVGQTRAEIVQERQRVGRQKRMRT